VPAEDVHTIFTRFTPDAQQTQPQQQQQQQQEVRQIHRAVLEDSETITRQQDAADNRRLHAMFDKALAAVQHELAPATVRLLTTAYYCIMHESCVLEQICGVFCMLAWL
jgi:hypothetical protein